MKAMSQNLNAQFLIPSVACSLRCASIVSNTHKNKHLKSDVFKTKTRCDRQLKAFPESAPSAWQYQPLEVKSVTLRTGNREVGKMQCRAIFSRCFLMFADFHNFLMEYLHGSDADSAADW
jgi:hypothetical protein